MQPFCTMRCPASPSPRRCRERIQQAGDQAAREGVRIAIELVEQMRTWARGIYLMPQFSRYDLSAEVVEGLK